MRRGAPRPASDDLRSWYDGLLASGFLRRRRHPCHHVFGSDLTQVAKIAGRRLPCEPFLTRGAAEAAGDVTGLLLFGG